MLLTNLRFRKVFALGVAAWWGASAIGIHAQTTEPSTAVPFFRKLLTEVLDKHPVVRSASRKIQAAEADIEAARWQFFPTPSIGIESSNQASTTLDSNTRFARLQQPLWTGGRLTAQVNKAQADQEVAHWTRHEQKQGLAVHWLELWADACGAQLRVDVYEASSLQHQSYLRQVQGRAKEGQIAQSEVQLAQSRLAATDADLETARAQQQQAHSRLRQMLGRPLPSTALKEGCVMSGTSRQVENLEKLKERAEKNDPVLRRNTASVRSLNAELEAIRAQRYPELYLRGEYYQGDMTGENHKASIGLSSNFGAGLSNASAQAATQARMDAQLEDFDARRRELSDQIASDDIQVTSQLARSQQLGVSLEAAGAYLQSAEKQFDAGRRSWQDLMSSAREATQLRVQLIDTQTMSWIAAQRISLMSWGLDAYLDAPEITLQSGKAGN